MALRYGSKEGNSLRYSQFNASALMYDGKMGWSAGGATDAKYFTFTLLEDDTYSIKLADYENCPKVITIPSTYNGKPVTVIGENAFYPGHGNGDLMVITIPEGITTIEASAFSNCYNISKITFPNSLTTIGESAFSSCKLSEIVFGTGLKSIGKSAFHDALKSWETLEIPDGVTSIDDYAFVGDDDLKKAYIPGSVITMGAYIFSGCDYITIYCEAESQPEGWDDWWNRNLSNDRYFPVVWGYTCQKEGHTYSSEVIEPDCLSFGITRHTCSKCGDTYDTNYVDELGHSASDWIIDTEATMYESGSKHKECTRCGTVLETETIPRIVTADSYFTFTEQTDGTYSIKAKDVSAMPSVVSIPDTYNGKAVTRIADDAFDGATTITKVVIPNSITSIGEDAFNNCNALIDVNIPNSVTTIEDYAFRYCSALPTIIIPSSVTTMGFYIFSNCKALSIKCEATEKPSGWDDMWNIDNRPVTWGYTG